MHYIYLPDLIWLYVHFSSLYKFLNVLLGAWLYMVLTQFSTQKWGKQSKLASNAVSSHYFFKGDGKKNIHRKDQYWQLYLVFCIWGFVFVIYLISVYARMCVCVCVCEEGKTIMKQQQLLWSDQSSICTYSKCNNGILSIFLKSVSGIYTRGKY